jgi:hypothetical protein
MPGPMPRSPLPTVVTARLMTFKSGCALARYIRSGWVSRQCPAIWVAWAERALCWRHKEKR